MTAKVAPGAGPDDDDEARRLGRLCQSAEPGLQSDRSGKAGVQTSWATALGESIAALLAGRSAKDLFTLRHIEMLFQDEEKAGHIRSPADYARVVHAGAKKAERQWDVLTGLAEGGSGAPDPAGLLRDLRQKSAESREAAPITIGISGSWGAGKSTTKQVIIDQLNAVAARTEQTATQAEKDRLERKRVWRQRLRFFGLDSWVARDKAEDVAFLVVDLNAWTFNGSDNVWASVLLALYEELENEYGPWELRTGLADLEEQPEPTGPGPDHPAMATHLLPSACRLYFRDYTLAKFLADITLLRPLLLGGRAAARSVAKSNAKSAVALAAIVALIAAVVVLYVQYQDQLSGAYAGLLAAIIPATATAAGVLERIKQYRSQDPAKKLGKGSAAADSKADLQDKVGFLLEVRRTVELLVRYVKENPVRRGERLCHLKVVLSVDDLDRCEPNTIMDVIRCIQMFLIEPAPEQRQGPGAGESAGGADGTAAAPVPWPISVLLFIDPAVVEPAIEAAFKENGVLVSGRSYLEKILQLLFVLPLDPVVQHAITRSFVQAEGARPDESELSKVWLHAGRVGNRKPSPGAAVAAHVASENRGHLDALFPDVVHRAQGRDSLQRWQQSLRAEHLRGLQVSHWVHRAWSAEVLRPSLGDGQGQLLAKVSAAGFSPRQIKRVWNTWLLITQLAARMDECWPFVNLLDQREQTQPGTAASPPAAKKRHQGLGHDGTAGSVGASSGGSMAANLRHCLYWALVADRWPVRAALMLSASDAIAAIEVGSKSFERLASWLESRAAADAQRVARELCKEFASADWCEVDDVDQGEYLTVSVRASEAARIWLEVEKSIPPTLADVLIGLLTNADDGVADTDSAGLGKLRLFFCDVAETLIGRLKRAAAAGSTAASKLFQIAGGSADFQRVFTTDSHGGAGFARWLTLALLDPGEHAGTAGLFHWLRQMKTKEHIKLSWHAEAKDLTMRAAKEHSGIHLIPDHQARRIGSEAWSKAMAFKAPGAADTGDVFSFGGHGFKQAAVAAAQQKHAVQQRRHRRTRQPYAKTAVVRCFVDPAVLAKLARRGGGADGGGAGSSDDGDWLADEQTLLDYLQAGRVLDKSERSRERGHFLLRLAAAEPSDEGYKGVKQAALGELRSGVLLSAAQDHAGGNVWHVAATLSSASSVASFKTELLDNARRGPSSDWAALLKRVESVDNAGVLPLQYALQRLLGDGTDRAPKDPDGTAQAIELLLDAEAEVPKATRAGAVAGAHAAVPQPFSQAVPGSEDDGEGGKSQAPLRVSTWRPMASPWAMMVRGTAREATAAPAEHLAIAACCAAEPAELSPICAVWRALKRCAAKAGFGETEQVAALTPSTELGRGAQAGAAASFELLAECVAGSAQLCRLVLDDSGLTDQHVLALCSGVDGAASRSQLQPSLTALLLAGNQLTAVPAEIRVLARLRELSLGRNRFTSVPPAIWELSDLTELHLHANQLTSLPDELWQMRQLALLRLNGNQLPALPCGIGQLARLTHLHLDSNRLASVPPELGRLEHLMCLGLGDNRLTSLPSEIGRLSKLTTLVLRLNQLTSLPADIWNLSQLKLLDMSDNQLTSLPAAVGKLTSLRFLGLYHNALTALPDEIGSLAELRKLHLGANRLATLPDALGQLSRLTVLWIHTNRLTMLPPAIGKLSQLESLNPERNQLKALPVEIGELSQLKELKLRGNLITALPTEIGRLPQLSKLDLGFNALPSVPAELGELSQLTELRLDHNQLKSVPDDIGNLLQLKTLVLARNQLTALPAGIGRLTNLTALDLQTNQLRALPAEIGRLAQLTHLQARLNQLESVPPEIGNLVQLRELHLDSNRLSAVPPQIGHLSRLATLRLNCNRLESASAVELAKLPHVSDPHQWGNPLASAPPDREMEDVSQLIMTTPPPHSHQRTPGGGADTFGGVPSDGDIPAPWPWHFLDQEFECSAAELDKMIHRETEIAEETNVKDDIRDFVCPSWANGKRQVTFLKMTFMATGIKPPYPVMREDEYVMIKPGELYIVTAKMSCGTFVDRTQNTTSYGRGWHLDLLYVIKALGERKCHFSASQRLVLTEKVVSRYLECELKEMMDSEMRDLIAQVVARAHAPSAKQPAAH